MTESRPPDLLEVGRFGRPHGVRGQVTILLSTDREERVAPGSRLWSGRWFTVSASRERSGRWVVDLEGVEDRTHAESLVNRTIWAEPIDDPDAVWIHQVIGARVVGVDGTDHGRCVAVVANPADDLLELDDGVLIPARFVERVDSTTAEVSVIVDPPEGLFDIFRSNDGDDE